MKKKMVVLGLSVMMLTACTVSEKPKRTMMDGLSEENKAKVTELIKEQKENDKLTALAVADVQVAERTGLYSVTGKIVNTGSSAVDNVSDILIFDVAGDLIRIKKISVKLEAGESMYFDEIVGEPKDTAKPESVKIQ